MDYQALLYDPIYSTHGVPASVILADGTTRFDGLTALDKTGGVDTGEPVQTQTILPAALFRMKELSAAGINKDELPGGTLILNGFNWRIDSILPKPAPTGENEGELQLLISAQEIASSE